MKRLQMMGVAVLLALVVGSPAPAGPLPGGRGRVTLLPAEARWFEGRGAYEGGSAFSRQAPAGSRAVYLMELAPGADYTLGMRYPAASRQKPSVALYDRWPGETGAKRYNLPMGPVLKTNFEKIEYRWRFAVSPRSKGRYAFLTVEAKNGFSGKEGPFRYSLYLTTPSISPMKQVGEGITYLRGPSDLMLSGQVDDALYFVEYPYSRKKMGRRDREGELIRNGDFRHGLRSWEIVPSGTKSDAGGQVSVGNDGLRLSNVGPGEYAGVRQSVKRYVNAVRSLLLTADLKLDKPVSRDISPNGDSPILQVSICYVDVEGGGHCGKNAYRSNFTTAENRSERGHSIEVKNGRWFRFEDELMELDPRPDVIESVSVRGQNLVNYEIRVDSISLISR